MRLGTNAMAYLSDEISSDISEFIVPHRWESTTWAVEGVFNAELCAVQSEYGMIVVMTRHLPPLDIHKEGKTTLICLAREFIDAKGGKQVKHAML